MRKKKCLPVIITFAAVSLIGILWVATPAAARLSCSLRIYCASAAADENAVDYLTDNGRRLIFANRESLQFLSKMALNGELADETNYYNLYAQLLPDYYVGDWAIGRNEVLFYWHFGRLYSISPGDDGMRRHFQELIDNAKRTYQDESGQTQPYQADQVEILHETGDKARDAAVTITDEKTVSELLTMHNALQIRETQLPIGTDRFVLTFYWKGEPAWTWYVAAWGDGGTVVTSSSLRRGNYTVENGFDVDRLAELSKGQRTEPQGRVTSLPNQIPSDIAIDYGKSDTYSKQDMNAAIELIEKEFATWEGCELHSISYTSDECNSKENIDWMNGLTESGNYTVTDKNAEFTQCIEFVSDFHSPKTGGDAWETDHEYTNWQWWLARTDNGEWNLITWGY